MYRVPWCLQGQTGCPSVFYIEKSQAIRKIFLGNAILVTNKTYQTLDHSNNQTKCLFFSLSGGQPSGLTISAAHFPIQSKLLAERSADTSMVMVTSIALYSVSAGHWESGNIWTIQTPPAGTGALPVFLIPPHKELKYLKILLHTQ